MDGTEVGKAEHPLMGAYPCTSRSGWWPVRARVGGGAEDVAT